MKDCCKIKEDPKWNFNKPCLQDHEHTEVYYKYTTTVKTTTPFNVPKFDNEVEIGLEDVVSVAPGAILWNLKVGGLTVKSYNAETKTVIATPANINVDFGSLVIAGTEFTIGIPNIGTDGKADYLDSPYLAADFISPAPGACQEASVTSVSGLGINNKVSVSGYVYRIGAIVNKSTLRLCNDGDGAEAGVVIRFDPEDCGEPSVPLIVYETNPCEATPVSTGNIVVCKDNGLTTIKGEADGQILRWNNNHKRWELVNAYLDENCTYLTTCFTVDTLDQAYVATVKNTAIFNVDNKVLIDDVKFIINEIVDSTHLKLKPETTFTEITTYPVGTNVCLESCCAWVPQVLEETVLDNDWIPKGVINYTTTPNKIDVYMLYVSHSFNNNYSGPTPLETTLPVIIPEANGQPGINFERKTSNFNIVNYNTKYKMNVWIRLYSYAHGMPNSTDNAAHKLVMKLSNTLTYTDYKFDTLTQTIIANNPIDFPESDVKTFTTPTGSDHPPQTLMVVQEVCIHDIAEYNPDFPQLSTVQIQSKVILEALKASDKEGRYTWYTSDGDISKIHDRGNIVHHMVIHFGWDAQ